MPSPPCRAGPGRSRSQCGGRRSGKAWDDALAHWLAIHLPAAIVLPEGHEPGGSSRPKPEAGSGAPAGDWLDALRAAGQPDEVRRRVRPAAELTRPASARVAENCNSLAISSKICGGRQGKSSAVAGMAVHCPASRRRAEDSPGHGNPQHHHPFAPVSLRNHSLAMRRDQLKSADNKPLPKNRESSMTLLDDLNLLTDQSLAVRDRHPENRTLSIVAMMLVSAITAMLADLRRQSLPQGQAPAPERACTSL